MAAAKQIVLIGVPMLLLMSSVPRPVATNAVHWSLHTCAAAGLGGFSAPSFLTPSRTTAGFHHHHRPHHRSTVRVPPLIKAQDFRITPRGRTATVYNAIGRSSVRLFSTRNKVNSPTKKAATVAPVVEISPSNHGTAPLLTFTEEAVGRSNDSIDGRLLKILKKDGMTEPTPIQSHAIPLLLGGHDVMASAQTGSGKTLMFCLPLADRLLRSLRRGTKNTGGSNDGRRGGGGKADASRSGGRGGGAASPPALILSPTRELAQQTATVLRRLLSHTPLRVALATGGSDTKSQRRDIMSGGGGGGGCDIIVGTPGRVLQFVDERSLRLDGCREVVVDEADRMLDLGFEPKLRRIARALGQPGPRRRDAVLDLRDGNVEEHRRTVLCSATFPPDVQRVASEFLRGSYYFVAAGRVGATHGNIEQRLRWVDGGRSEDRRKMVVDEVRRYQANDMHKGNARGGKGKGKAGQQHKEDDSRRVIVFTNTKDEAEELGSALTNVVKGGVKVVHGDKVQSERNKSLSAFRDGRIHTLVATDVASRGLDVPGVGLVVQADAPRDVDSYVHRVGRTGRAGRSGRATAFIDGRSVSMAPDLVKLLREAEQDVPTWLLGMAHVATARVIVEEGAIAAGGGGSLDDGRSTTSSRTTASSPSSHSGNNTTPEKEEGEEHFTGQDFRSSAAAGTWGSERDTTYRSFDEEAYSSLDGSSVSSSSTAQMNVSADEDSATESIENGVNGEDLEGEQTENFVLDNISDELAESEDEGRSSTFKEALLFERRKPSKDMKQALKRISGSDEVGEKPNAKVLSVLSKRGSNQRQRFEYLGMFPFDTVADSLKPRGTGNRNEKRYRDMPRLLMVAEKPSIAKALADSLSGQNGARQRRGISRALPVYEFTASSDAFRPGQPNNGDGKPIQCLVTVTSVVGHVFSLGFKEESSQNRQSHSDPSEYFRMPVVKQEEGTTGKLRVVEHLRALAANSDHLVLWLDCDAEGENIAHEVIGVTRRALEEKVEEQQKANPTAPPMRRIHRARFSAVTRDALRDAFADLGEPDAALSRSVDARQELDLRVGVALTRLLTWRCVGLARRHFNPATKLVSYGPCQTPALSFCVDRARQIEAFKPTDYWKVHTAAASPKDSKESIPLRWVPLDEKVGNANSRRSAKGGPFEESATLNQMTAQRVVDLASAPKSEATVVQVNDISERMNAPLGLNTVGLLSAGSKAMGMSPKQVMNVAEKLYSAGFISYPRTETTKYDPKGFDVRSFLRQHTSHPEWGRTAGHLLRTKYAKSGRPPTRGKDVGDHPPITTLKAATRAEVGGGAAWRVYEFVTRTFLGSLSDDLSYTRRVADLQLEGKDSSVKMPSFEINQVNVDKLGFAGACPWVLRDIGATKQEDGINLREGTTLSIVDVQIERCATRPPRFLQEHELIEQMDKNRIGTDASMAGHVSNIVDRGYVVLCDETGEPLRPPRPPTPGRPSRPRQIGRYLVPTPLGSALIDLFEGPVKGDGDFEASSGAELSSEDSMALLARPLIRAQMESEVAQIASGQLDKIEVLEKNIEWFEARYNELERSLSRSRTSEFASSLKPTKASLGTWRRLGAFESPAPKQKENHPQRSRRKKPPKKKASSKQPRSNRSHGGGKREGRRRRSNT